MLQQLPNVVPLLMVTRTASVLMHSIGIPEEEADHATGFICEFCSFEDPKGFGRGSRSRLENKEDEEEYILEEDESLQRKRNRSERHHAMSSSCIGC